MTPAAGSIKWLVPTGPIVFCDAAEALLPSLDRHNRRTLGDLLRRPLVLRVGSLSNYALKQLMDELLGATNFTAAANYYWGLWTAALDQTFNGATASEAAYTSYARALLANNGTNYAAGSGTGDYTKQAPSAGTLSWATSTGGSATVTYVGQLDGNLGTSADKGIWYASVTSTAIASGDTPQAAANAFSIIGQD